MNQNLKTILIVLASVAIAAALIFAGFFIGQRQNPQFGYGNDNADNSRLYYGRGMMGGGFSNSRNNSTFGMGRGMMGYGFSSGNTSDSALSVDSARSAVQDYLDALGNDDLEIQEVMLFSQNAYALVAEKSTGMGAMELLVDPSTLNVFPEYGPNRMWNLKYGMMGTGGCGFGHAGACINGLSSSSADIPAEMTLSMDEAATIADEYLADNIINGATVSQPGTAFYGYYTFDYMQNGQMAGMLSVNGSSAQVWLHTWHGQFIEEWELAEAD